MNKRSSTPTGLPSSKRQEFCSSVPFSSAVIEDLVTAVQKEFRDVERSTELDFKAFEIHSSFYLALPQSLRDRAVPLNRFKGFPANERDQIFDVLKRGVGPDATFANKQAVANLSKSTRVHSQLR